MPSNHLILCYPLFFCLQSLSASGSFLMSWLFASGGQSIAAAASASVLPMNIPDWFPLGLTGLISLLFKWPSRVFFSNTTVQKHHFFSTQPSLWSNSHINTWLLENHSSDSMDFCWQSNVSALKKYAVYGFVIYSFYYVEICSIYSCFLEGFIINGCWIVSKALCASIEIIIWFLSFNLLMWCITLIDLWILKNPCISGIKPTWSLSSVVKNWMHFP